MLLAAAAALPSAALADYPAGYYDALDGKTGVELKKAAKAVAKNHTVISYGAKTWEAFEKTDVTIVNGREAWWDMYSNDVVYLPGHDGMNIEHSVANSWWGKTKNDAYKDLFHLNPSEADANNRKANYPLGEINGTPTWTNGVTNVGSPVSGQGGGSNRVYEPKDCYKGDFARAFMYVFTVYDDISWAEKTAWMYAYPRTDLSFKPWASELLLKWNDADPVDDKESNRNEAIYGIQHNRNPYIDLPAMCHYIWGKLSGTPFEVENGGSTPTPPTPPTPPSTTVTELYCDWDEASDIDWYLQRGWTNYKASGSLSGWFIKDYQGNNYASCSAYKGAADGGPYEYWLITPAIDVAEGRPVLTFTTQGAYGCDDCSLEVYALDSANPLLARQKKLDAAICTPQPDGATPVYSDWTPSGNVNLDNLGLGDKVYVGFRYWSARGGKGNSATYCLDNVKVSSVNTGVCDTAVPERLFMALGGRGNIRVLSSEAMEEVTVYDLSGRVAAVFTVEGEAVVEMPAGIYIVTTPGTTPAKVLVH